MNKMEVAKTILDQLGGKVFIAHTGAKDIFATDDCTRNPNPGLSFKLPSRFAKNGINYVKIFLNPMDTYTVCFQKWNWGRNKCLYKTCHQDIYNDMLQDLFTKETGLFTH